MNEGWLDDQHFILFTEAEAEGATINYSFGTLLPGFSVIGLRGWDDFLLKRADGSFFAVPVVPIDAEHLAPTEVPDAAAQLEFDERFAGKIKWYVKPLVFGGDAQSQDNVLWVTHEQHHQLVAYWNKLYRDVKGTSA